MNVGNKRKDNVGGDSKPKRVKKECDYGEKCYRRNPAHFREFSHKHLEEILDNYSGSGDYPVPERFELERLSINEQLDVIVDKELYTPWKDKLASQANATAQTTPKTSNTNQDSSSNSALSSKNISSNLSVSKKNNSSNSAVSSKDMNSNSAMSSKENSNSAVSSKDMSSKISSSSERTENNEPRKESTEISSNKNVASTSNTEIGWNNTPEYSDYKKAPDYRPVVPPGRRAEAYLKVVRPSGLMEAKHAASAPYHIFYTTITDAKETHGQPNSITFLELLDPSLGELKCSLQINFMVELGWLLAQYYFAGYSEKRLTILYGEDMPELRTISQKKPHVDAHRVIMKTPFGTHHTKMMLLCYEDNSMRVVVSTANLYLDDWENRTQGLWFSPRCPPLPPSSSPLHGESPTMFKRCLIRYLQHYHIKALDEYIERVRRCDFSHINVFLVCSVPGSHGGAEWGLRRVSGLLREHAAPVAQTERWPLLAQASSLGSYGPSPQLWLTGDFLHHFTRTAEQPHGLAPPVQLKLIYPSLENVRQSHDGLLGGGCLPYGAAVNTKQPWLIDYLYQWRATSSGRNRAMPHLKSYTRMSTRGDLAAYYLLTSGNVSKAAWGTTNKGDGNLRIMSYEAGVLLLPRFVINEDVFPLTGENKLPLAYDVPPTKYAAGMSPWVMDYLHT